MAIRHTGGIVYLRGPQPEAYERLEASRDMWYEPYVQMLQENKRLTKELEQACPEWSRNISRWRAEDRVRFRGCA